MPRAVVAGPVGLDVRWHAFDLGTLALAPHLPPGPVGFSVPSASPPTAGAKTQRAIDIDKAVEKILEIALPNYSGRCARHVRMALEAGGADMRSRPVYAKDYGRTLVAIGFRAVEIEPSAAQKGDIAVFQDYAGQREPAGHIQMFDGNQWVSDRAQPRFLAHQVHYKDISYVIYRP